jgi:branched-subunit amino acid ABC-type transport system permease component
VLVSFDFAELARRFVPVVADWSIPASYKPAVVYVAVILLLLLRPSGLMRMEA